MKERLAMTDVRKGANRVTFGEKTGEYGDDAMGLTFGTLGKGGAGAALRVAAKGKDKRRMGPPSKRRRVSAGSSGATSGLASSLAFTPVQGIELVDTDFAKTKAKAETEDPYFSGLL